MRRWHVQFLRAALLVCGSVASSSADELSEGFYVQPEVGAVFGDHTELAAVTHEVSAGGISFAKEHDKAYKLALHALFALGTDDGGRFAQLRGGLEYGYCLGGGFICVVLAADYGVQWVRARVLGVDRKFRDPVLVPRVGLQIGLDRLHVRLALEAPLHKLHPEGTENLPGLTVSLAAGWRFGLWNP